MSAHSLRAYVIAGALGFLAGSAGAVPPEIVGYEAHLGHVLIQGIDTPGGQGLLPLAETEAARAAEHSKFLVASRGKTEEVKKHAGHVIHALDPSAERSGPGTGYGELQAARGIIERVRLAAKAPDAPAGAAQHAKHVERAMRNVEEWSKEAVEVAKKLRTSAEPGETAALSNRVHELTLAILEGRDANRDGKTTWEKGEGGLKQAAEHLKLMRAG
ncbi:MAG: hypothetical protein HY900_21710 [Deltaproteobacteria bacterium]|nr:hypothetical protein [Deltaproteobacteria bacterium]